MPRGMFSFCFLLWKKAAVHGNRARSGLGRELREENPVFFAYKSGILPVVRNGHGLIGPIKALRRKRL